MKKQIGNVDQSFQDVINRQGTAVKVAQFAKAIGDITDTQLAIKTADDTKTMLKSQIGSLQSEASATDDPYLKLLYQDRANRSSLLQSLLNRKNINQIADLYKDFTPATEVSDYLSRAKGYEITNNLAGNRSADTRRGQDLDFVVSKQNADTNKLESINKALPPGMPKFGSLREAEDFNNSTVNTNNTPSTAGQKIQSELLDAIAKKKAAKGSLFNWIPKI